MTARRVAVFGAGNIGRGLVGWLFGKAGWNIVFVDISPSLVRRLNEAGSYQVIEVDGIGRTTTNVTGVTAVDATNVKDAVTAVASCDLVCTSVGAGVLGHIAPTVASALRRPGNCVRNVLACENADPNTAMLRRHIESLGVRLSPSVGFPETLVDRMVPGAVEGDLALEVERRFEFKVALEGWSGTHPGPEGFELVDGLATYRIKKLWLVNGLHAAAAFLGLRAGHETIAEAVADPHILSCLGEINATMSTVLATEYPVWDQEELMEYGRSNLDRFAGTFLVDPVRRVARNPLRKLAPDERLVGPARAAARLGLPVGALVDAIRCGVSLTDDRVEGIGELREAVEAAGVHSVLGLEEDEPLARIFYGRATG